jgi:hypothetical protein
MLNGSHAATPYRFVACLTLIIAAITAHSQDWKTYTYAADGFSVSLPSDPKADKESVDTDGGPVELRSYLATDGDVALYVGLCDYGPKAAQANSDDVLQGAKKGALNNAKATLVSEKPITLGANHGLEFEATSSSGHISARIYMVGGILYQMIVVVPPNGSYANRTRFLDSFHLIVPAKKG